MRWPNQASFLLFTVASSGSCGPTREVILSRTYTLVLCSVYEMPSSLRKHLFSKAWIFFSVSARRVHDSQPYKSIDTTRDLYSLNLVWKLMVLLRHSLVSLAIAAVAVAILILISAVQLPSLERVALPILEGIT